uniref:Uncharacterized protein n=1 Tax=Arundo donax TaxID=35708 RepID=A0A0A8ZQI3_ARUDO
MCYNRALLQSLERYQNYNLEVGT